ncbi:hypothetical protein [Nocardia harenae]|uniref:hypothetical protein n=1 Tax=Nocardia harenae TaxID=358707 RepID=UPI00082CF4DB|nr:hypothetical protein [Nocardia harenae]
MAPRIATLAFLTPGNFADYDPYTGLEDTLQLFEYGERLGFDGDWRAYDLSHTRIERLAENLRGDYLGGPDTVIHSPGNTQRPRLQPHSPGLVDRLAETAELRLELPYEFHRAEYEQILHDAVELVAPALGWNSPIPA